ncbi:MAG: AraC family transcriptional regulator [Henriciella sp.]|uniref:AraC family transcriptional regulator n=1 Tax=Henriciella sp. TaxID=1968823 RepID=UPI0032EB28EF
MSNAAGAVSSVPLVSAAATGDIAAFIRKCGLDAEPVFLEAGLDVRISTDPYQMIELSKFTHLLKAAQDATHCATIGLNVGGRQDPARWGAFGYLVLNSPTLGDALRNVVAHATIWQTGTHFAFRQTKEEIGVEYAITHPSVANREQDAEFSIAYVKNIVDRLIERSATPTDVFFEHSAIADIDAYEKVFGVRPLFNQPTNAIYFPRLYENRRVAFADLHLFPVIKRHLMDMAASVPGSDSLEGNIVYHIRQFLPRGMATLENVAAAMGLQSRTMQRRLRQTGMSFTDLLDRVRYETATHHLTETTMSISEIAYLLGYCDTSAFIKSFKKQAGKTPSRFREWQRLESGGRAESSG